MRPWSTAGLFLCGVCQQVLSNEFSAVRQVREKQRKQPNHGPAPTAAAIEAGTGTLTANTISLLRHAFILIAGAGRQAQ